METQEGYNTETQEGYMLRLFKKKTLQDQADALASCLNHAEEKITNLYRALVTQKKVIDAVLDHLELEPVTIVTTSGSTNPEKEEVFRLRKKTKKKVKPDPYEEE